MKLIIANSDGADVTQNQSVLPSDNPISSDNQGAETRRGDSSANPGADDGQVSTGYAREEWRQIPEYPDNYEISDFGRVRMTLRKSAQKRMMRSFVNDSGYRCVGIRVGGKLRNARIARLVAAAFISNPENKPQVNHIDGIKTNNHVLNLEWVSPRENIDHAIRTGLMDHGGERNPAAKLNPESIVKIRSQVLAGRRRAEVADEFGVNVKTISSIVRRKLWQNVA